MQQKYLVFIDKDKKHLLIQEFATIDKDVMAFLNEESYDLATVKKAAKNDIKHFMGWLRTENFFPPDFFMSEIAAKVLQVIKSGKEEELYFNDTDFISVQSIIKEEEVDELDEILEEEIEEDFEDKDILDLDAISLDEEE